MATGYWQWDRIGLITKMLPWFRRKSYQIRWLASLTKPLNTLHNQFTTERDAQLERLSVTSETLSLQEYLRDFFSVPGIFIDNVSDSRLPLSLWLNTEGQKPSNAFLSTDSGATPTSMWLASEAEGLDDFIVNYPAGSLTASQVNQLRSIVDLYKGYDKKYSLNTY